MDARVTYDLSYGVYVVGTVEGDKKVGCVINSAMQVSAQPISLAISINKDNYTNHVIRDTGEFTLSILSEKTKPATLGLFGFRTSADTDKFAAVPHRLVGNSMPILLDNTCGFIRCKVTGILESHTHTIFVADAVEGERLESLPPMTYLYYHTVVKGKTPAKASTFVDPASLPPASGSGYTCDVCGYHIDLTEEKFQSLPDTFRCPICGVPKTQFSKV